MATQSDYAARAPSEETAGSPFLSGSNPDRVLGGGAASGPTCAAKPNTDTSFLERFIPVLLRCLAAWNV